MLPQRLDYCIAIAFVLVEAANELLSMTVDRGGIAPQHAELFMKLNQLRELLHDQMPISQEIHSLDIEDFLTSITSAFDDMGF